MRCAFQSTLHAIAQTAAFRDSIHYSPRSNQLLTKIKSIGFRDSNLEFVGFELIGNQYQQITPNQRGWLWSQVRGLYLGVEAGKLRYFTLDGDLVPTPEEAAFVSTAIGSTSTAIGSTEKKARVNDVELRFLFTTLAIATFRITTVIAVVSIRITCRQVRKL